MAELVGAVSPGPFYCAKNPAGCTLKDHMTQFCSAKRWRFCPAARKRAVRRDSSCALSSNRGSERDMRALARPGLQFLTQERLYRRGVPSACEVAECPSLELMKERPSRQ